MSEAKTPDKDDIIRILMKENDLLREHNDQFRHHLDIERKYYQTELMQAAMMLLMPDAWDKMRMHKFIAKYFVDPLERKDGPTPPAPQE